jgi:broad specificity phosphatase PhoE
MQQDSLTVLDYLRHGEPSGGNRFRGNGVDDPLTEKGWAQMREAVAGVDSWQLIVSSPMRRCVEFAERLASERGIPLRLEHDLREVGFGSWEGAVREDIIVERKDEYDAFRRDPVNNRPPGAEPLYDFGRRVSRVFDRLIDTHPGQHLLVVAHAGVIRATLGHITQAPAVTWYRTDVGYAGITRFVKDSLGPRLVRHNWRRRL